MSERTRSKVGLLSLLALCLLLLAPGTPGFAWSVAGADKSGGSDDGGGGGGGGGGGNGGESALKLRLNDAIGQPGGMVALVVRTYAARPVRQGRITVRVKRPPRKALGIAVGEVAQPARPLTFIRGVVFSANNDAVSTSRATNASDGQTVGVDFSSQSASVNAADGPLAVIYMRVDRGVAPGSVYDIEIDPAATGLTDASGAPIGVTPIQAQLRVRPARAPYWLGAEGDELAPGELAEMGVETAEPFAVFGGRLTLRWDPAAQAGPPQVTMDPRYGKSTFQVVTSAPGLLVVTFQSPKGTLNSVPGRFLSVAMPTNPAAPLGWSAGVALDPAGSWLVSKRNRRLAVSLEAGSLDFR